MTATTTSTSILEALQQQLNPSAIEQMSQQLGSDPATTSNAISLAIPALINGLSSNAANPQGAMALDTALGAHDGSILGNLGGLLGGSGGGIGGKILGHILGSRRGPVEQGVGRASGMNAQQVGQLLMMLAPLVMGVLGRMKKDRGVSAEQLPEILGQSKAEIEQRAPGLGGVFDKNQDGQIADDLARLGTSVLGGLFGGGARPK